VWVVLGRRSAARKSVYNLPGTHHFAVLVQLAQVPSVERLAASRKNCHLKVELQMVAFGRCFLGFDVESSLLYYHKHNKKSNMLTLGGAQAV
jgi:hypothetical protein